jgi:hypothetical protein
VQIDIMQGVAGAFAFDAGQRSQEVIAMKAGFNFCLMLACACATVIATTACGGTGHSPATLQSILVGPANQTIAPGSSQPLSATGKFSDGSSQDITTSASWSASHGSVASVSTSGVATGIADGTTNITATSSGVSGSTMLIVQSGSPDPLGSVAAQSETCASGGVTGSACYSLTVSCPGVADIHVEVKSSAPSGNPSGTVVFIGGGGATGFYEGYTYGANIIDSVVKGGYTAVQVSFPDLSLGWLTGPGGTRALACRPATAFRWMYDNAHTGGATAPFCAHGESAGSTAITDSMSHFGMASFLSMVEPAAGPPLARIDNGCLCQQPPIAGPCSSTLIPQCYEPDVKTIVDTTYPTPLCTEGNASDTATFVHDSVLSGSDTLLAFPNTDVHQLIGDLDLTAAVPEAYEWSQSVSTKKITECVANSGHSMPNFQDAATKITADLTTYCKLQ